MKTPRETALLALTHQFGARFLVLGERNQALLADKVVAEWRAAIHSETVNPEGPVTIADIVASWGVRFARADFREQLRGDDREVTR